MEGTACAWCKFFRRISLHLSLYSSDTSHSFTSIWMGPSYSHYWSIIRGLCYPHPQNGIPTGTVNSKYAFFPSVYSTKLPLIKEPPPGETCKGTKAVLLVTTLMSFLPPFCSNRLLELFLSNIFSHHNLIHDSTPVDISTYPWFKRKNCK